MTCSGRLPGANSSSNFRAFIRNWDRGGISSTEAEVVVGQFGNLNHDGEPEIPSWNILRADSRFESFIEPGVRDLVLFIVDDLGLITYSSCEGHQYIGTSIKASVRSISIAPRTLEEAGVAWTLLEECANMVESDHVAVCVRARPLRAAPSYYLTMVLSFDPIGDEVAYLDELDKVYNQYLLLLRKRAEMMLTMHQEQNHA